MQHLIFWNSSRLWTDRKTNKSCAQKASLEKRTCSKNILRQKERMWRKL